MTHSRSSSEMSEEQYKENLPVHIECFIDDFEIRDLTASMLKNVLTTNEYYAIAQEKNPERQNLRLLWTLSTKTNKEIELFLKIIKKDYPWIVEKVQTSTGDKNFNSYIDFVRSHRSNDQKHTDYNVHRMDLYCKLKHALLKLERNHFVILSGDLGTGKKWLTKDVCFDFSVLKAMGFKIFFIDVDNCSSPEDDLEKLENLRIQIGDCTIGNISPIHSSCLNVREASYGKEYMKSISNRILASQQRLKTSLQSPDLKECLVVLQNVENVKTWKAFNLGCKTLLITRYKVVVDSISKKLSRNIEMNGGLTENETYDLFEKITKSKIKDFKADVLNIYEYSDGHPRVLDLSAKIIQNKRMSWEELMDALKQSKIADNKLNLLIEKSLNVLPIQEWLDFYATFAIFPHSIEIPIKLVAALWEISEKNAKDIIDKFDEYSFVKNVIDSETNETYCKIPFIYSSHFSSSQIIKKKLKDIRVLHNKVVDYYQIDKAIEEISEPNLFSGQNTYFFLCIEHHIKESGRTDLFSKLFLDYGFLEQKLRAVGLLNVLRSLKFYENEITNYDPRRKKTLMAICEFLPKIEEKLVHSNDTSLLQYALMASGEVYSEALKQVHQFPNHVWFREKGNFHQRRQIAQIPKPPKIVHSLENESCLILLDNNDMILTDISTDSRNSQILFENTICETGNVKNADIFEVRLFNENNFILTLDTKGQLKLWRISTNSKRQSVDRSGSKKQKVNPLQFNQHLKQIKRRYKQAIHDNSDAKLGKIIAFYIEQTDRKEFYLHLAFNNGDICVFLWDSQNEDFHYSRTPILRTKFVGIRIIVKLLTSYYFLFNSSGEFAIWNLRDSSKMPNLFDWPHLLDWNNLQPIFICYELRPHLRDSSCIIFVYNSEVFQLELSKRPDDYLNGEYKTIYKVDNPDKAITCARISPDGKYLLLGTKSGLVVVDLITNSEILRSNVSDAITCFDICPLDDAIYKYYIACGVKNKNVLYLVSILQPSSESIVWSHSVSNLNNKYNQEGFKDPQLDPGVWLKGRKLYHIVYDDTSSYLLAVDSKRRIHKVRLGDSKDWVINQTYESFYQKKGYDITALTAYKDTCFIGYANGAIFNLTNDRFEEKFTDHRIHFLQLINENILIASTDDLTRLSYLNDQDSLILPIDTIYCFQIFEKYLVLVSRDGYITVVHAADRFEAFDPFYILEGAHQNDIIVSCDLQNNLLLLALTNCKCILLGQFKKVDNKPMLYRHELKINELDNVEDYKLFTCLKASNNGKIVAIGSENGLIEVFKLTEKYDLAKIFILQSHTSRINDLKFSPNNEVLVSCGEQLCFWSINYILNNILQVNSTKRHSRFKSQSSHEVEEVDAKVFDKGYNQFLEVNEKTNGNMVPAKYSKNITNPAHKCFLAWESKKGYGNKPELLACLKFDGNQADWFFANNDFTQFHTIDDEGVYYHLELYDFIKPSYNDSHNYNGNIVTEDLSLLNINGNRNSDSDHLDSVDIPPDIRGSDL